MIVDAGKRLILDLLSGSGAPVNSVKVGTSNTVESATDIDLGGSIGVAKLVDGFTAGIGDIVFETVYSYNEGNGTINEVGLFASDGTMLCRKVVAQTVKDSTKTMKIRYKITIKRAGE